MANITPDATSNGLAASATTLSVSHTCTTNPNRVLWVNIIGSLGATDLITGVTYAGISMVFIKNIQISGNRWSSLWKLIAPTTGTNNIVATSSSADRIELYASSYYNVRQTVYPDDVSINTVLASTSITGTANIYSNNSWLVAGFNPAGTGSASTGSFARSVTVQGGGIYDSNTSYGLGSHSMTNNCQTFPTSIIIATMEPVGTVADGLVAYYKLDGNSNDSVGGNNGTDTAVTYSAANGKLIQGAGFNGTTSLINLGSASSLGISGALTISAWVYPTTGSIQNLIVSNYSSGNRAQYTIKLDAVAANTFVFNINPNGSEQTYSSGATIPLSKWTHVAVVKDSVNVYMYVNGALLTTTAIITPLAGAQPAPTYIGSSQQGGGFFAGNIDEVGIWLRPLSSSEITNIYNNGVGLQYPFGGMSGSLAAMLM